MKVVFVTFENNVNRKETKWNRNAKATTTSLNKRFNEENNDYAHFFTALCKTIGSLSKPRRRRQWERHQTKGLMSKTIAVHLRYKYLYISLSSSAKQQHEMTKFCGVYERWTTPANISYFHLELNAVVAYVAVALFSLAYWTDLDNREFRL